MESEVIHKLVCLNLSHSLQGLLSWTSNSKAVPTFYNCGLFHLLLLLSFRLLLVERLKAALTQIRTTLGQYFQSMTETIT